MKLEKWKCGTCNFEWFEPKTRKSHENIDHGCPQGCDDSGKIVDRAESTDNINDLNAQIKNGT